MLLATREENDIKIYKRNSPGNYTQIKSFQLPLNAESHFIDIFNTIFYTKENDLYKINESAKINAKSIDKILQVNLSECTAFYYKSELSLNVIKVYANHYEESEVISAKNDFNFFVNENEAVFIWKENNLSVVLNEQIKKTNVNFLIKDIKQTSQDKIIMISEEWNIYLYDFYLCKVIGGIRTIDSKIVAYNSFPTSNLFILCTNTVMFVLDVFNRRKSAEVSLKNVNSFEFYSQDTLIIHSDKIYEFNLSTHKMHEIIHSQVKTFNILKNNDLFENKEFLCDSELNMSEIMHKSENISYVDTESTQNRRPFEDTQTNDLSEMIETKVLNLKSEIFKVFFRIQDEIDALKERISQLEKEMNKK